MDSADGTHQVHMDGDFVWRLADLSVLRAAFLASFAAFGSNQVFRPAFAPL